MQRHVCVLHACYIRLGASASGEMNSIACMRVAWTWMQDLLNAKCHVSPCRSIYACPYKHASSCECSPAITQCPFSHMHPAHRCNTCQNQLSDPFPLELCSILYILLQPHPACHQSKPWQHAWRDGKSGDENSTPNHRQQNVCTAIPLCCPSQNLLQRPLQGRTHVPAWSGPLKQRLRCMCHIMHVHADMACLQCGTAPTPHTTPQIL